MNKRAPHRRGIVEEKSPGNGDNAERVHSSLGTLKDSERTPGQLGRQTAIDAEGRDRRTERSPRNPRGELETKGKHQQRSE